MELLLKLTPPEDIQQHVLPMLYRGLDSDTPQIHELCLSVLPTFAGLLDHANIKNSVLPRIKKLCLSTSNLSVRVNCLLCIGRLLEHLDKWLVLDEILPFLPQIPSREPAILMGILGIYKLTLNHKKLGITKEIIATRILPFLMPLCIENGLSLAQFNALVALVKQMFQIVESEHRSKLEQLNTVQEQQKVLESTMPMTSSGNKVEEMDGIFSSLGLESFVFKKSDCSDIEDKRRLAKQQEIAEVLRNQKSLEPIPVSQSQSSFLNLSKDLTSSLLESDFKVDIDRGNINSSNSVTSNLSNTSFMKPTTFNNQNMLLNNHTLPSNQTSMLSSSQNNVPNNQTSIMNNQWSNWQNNSSQPALNINFNTSSLNFTSPNANRFTQNSNFIKRNNNWDAFNILSNNQPLLQPSANNSNSNVNRNTAAALSKDEIMDLLS